jgi:hypothetical protein
MANYPSHTISIDSVPKKEGGISDDFSEPGTQHSRTFHSRQYYRFPITHPSLTQAEVDALDALYEAGPRDFYTLTYYNVSPQVTYNVKFLHPPEITVNHGNGRFQVEVLLRGYRN